MRILSPDSAPSALRSAPSPKWAGRGQSRLPWPAGTGGGVPHPVCSSADTGAGTDTTAAPGTDTGIGCLPLPHRPEAGCEARRAAQAVLDGWQVPEETAADVVLVISELVTNALNHALPAVCLHMTRLTCGTVRVEVTDGGPCGAPLQRDPGDGGRGLALVQALAQAHGRHVSPGGTLAWAEFAAPAPA
ncbi:ATP-binding protein [Actinacidiphila bryophytorum]|uniref:ATP-binding protein n=1 Tax=Actinacidiphila bryophytorum TaxID=1436133 RepID=UPI002176B1A0|nr:ATP-binding protein [Actinacidiphila bryophytorum]UWE08736.1 ATP-binding protein [Actinacidiphila bryophytorum]